MLCRQGNEEDDDDDDDKEDEEDEDKDENTPGLGIFHRLKSFFILTPDSEGDV